jgi:hypothetical protein
MPPKPWIEGPLELLKHGLEHLKLESAFDARIAMISIDNAIELMIKTYLGLPTRVTGIKRLTRRRYAEICQSFPSLLDGFEEFAPDKLVGIELGDIEWFHQLRNQLYHEGNGITVEREKVEGYAALAKILFSNLFEIDVEDIPETEPHSLIGEFFYNWASLEQELIRLRDKYAKVKKDRVKPLRTLVSQLEAEGILHASSSQQLNTLRLFRNELAHGFATPSPAVLKTNTDTVKQVVKILKEL